MTETQLLEIKNLVYEFEQRIHQLENRVAELEGKDKRSKAFQKPTQVQVSNYVMVKGLTQIESLLFAEKFVHFYESKGWMIGKNKMKSWESAVATWLKSGQYNTTQTEQDRIQKLQNKWL